MNSYLVISVDPSKIGSKTSGTGLAFATITPDKLEDNNFEITIRSKAIMGVNFETQNDYNTLICSEIEDIIKWVKFYNFPKENILIRIEEYIEYQNAATKYTTNGVAEMIGAIKLTFGKDYDIVMRKAQVIKTRWDSVVMKKMNLLDDNGLCVQGLYIKDGKIKVPILENKDNKYIKTTHEYDAYRHLIDELYFGQWGKGKWRKK